MAKFCGKCGSRLDEATGLCPNCDREKLIPERREPVHPGAGTEGSVSGGKRKLTKKEKRALKKANRTTAQKAGSVLIKALAIILATAILFSAGLGLLVYFNVVDVPFVDGVFDTFGIKKKGEGNKEEGGDNGGSPDNGGGSDNGGSGENNISNDFTCIDGSAVKSKISDEQSAREALKEASGSLGISDVDSELGDCTVSELPDETYYKFEQEYNDVPVYGRSVIVSADENGDCMMITGSYKNVSGVNQEIKCDENAAAEVIRKKYGDETSVYPLGKYIYASGDQPYQVWAFSVTGNDVNGVCFIATSSGAIVDEISNAYSENVTGRGEDIDGEEQTFNTQKKGDEYYLEDVQKDIEIYDAQNTTLEYEFVIIDSNDKLYRYKDGGWVDEKGKSVSIEGEDPPYVIKDENGNTVDSYGLWGVALKTKNIFTTLKAATSKSTDWDNKKAVTLMSRISKIYDFWNTQFGRKGFDGRQGKVVAVYDDYMNIGWFIPNSKNAYSASSYGIPITVLSFQTDNSLSYDVIAHEYMHSVEKSISNLTYNGESGALMEAYSDIFGEIVEDWQDDDSLNNTCDWIHNGNRNLIDPGTNSYPSVYHGENWASTVSSDDHGGVHTNNMVVSHAAYLMSNSDGDNHEFTKLSVSELSNLFYYSLYNITSSDCSFDEFAAILLKRAEMLTDRGRFTNKQYLNVEYALKQVGMLPSCRLYTVGKEFDLNVIGLDGELYDNYHMKLAKIDTSAPLIGPNFKLVDIEEITELISEEDITEAAPKHLSLNTGAYLLTLKDNEHEDRIRLIILKVTESGVKTKNIYTDFNESKIERDIVLVLDVSGSMSGDPISETKKAASKFVDTVLGYSAEIGIVKYNGSAEVVSEFSMDMQKLKDDIGGLDSGGSTNIEDGLIKADEMLAKGDAKKKIIVLMSDGEPNRGKEGDSLIAYANELKDKGTYIYTLGFFESLSDKSGAQHLMEQIASPGCHYEVSDADSLVYFFGDIADQISGQKFIYVRIACPVDVSVSYNGETLDSSENGLNTRTSFGSLTFEEAGEYYGQDNEVTEGGDTVKTLRLKEGVDYDVSIVGTGSGRMNYSIGFMDEEGEYSDFRRFNNIRITRRTKIDTVAEVADTTTLNVDEDGDGKYDIKYQAEANGYGKEINHSAIIYIILILSGVLVLLIVVLIIIIKSRKRKAKAR